MNEDLQATICSLMNGIEELEANNDGLEDLTRCLVTKECLSNCELQRARKELIVVLLDFIFANGLAVTMHLTCSPSSDVHKIFYIDEMIMLILRVSTS
jgi:hypothetical protein